MCQAAINTALKLNGENDFKAASVLLTINGHSLWEAQRQQFPESINIQEYSQRTTTKDGSIGFWRKFNNCWLKLGRNISEILQQCTPLDCEAKESLEKWLDELVDHIVNISDFLEGFGLVDYKMGIWEEDIVACM
jgi:hypothetical protein